MELLGALLALISIHAVIVAAKFAFVISRGLLWPLLWLVNHLKRYTIRLAQGNSQGREVRDRQLVPGDDV